MTTCRCRILNVLAGDPARDYVNAHLVPESSERRREGGHYRCPDTAITWVYEPSPTTGAPRLRRTDHRR